MKKFRKRLLAILTAFVLIMVPFTFTGCGNASISFNEFQKVQLESAKSFKAGHTTCENFSDITYHWVKDEVLIEKNEVEYNQATEGQDYVTEIFEDERIEHEELWFSVKKSDDGLIAKLIVNRNVESSTHSADDSDNDHIKVETNTVDRQDVYILTPVVKNDETMYVITLYRSNKFDDENETLTKLYQEIQNGIEGLNDLILNNAVKRANNSVINLFFGYNDYIFENPSVVNVSKSGNEVKLSINYDATRIRNNFRIFSNSLKANVVFKNNKILKANSTFIEELEDEYWTSTVTFDYVNSATIEEISLIEYAQYDQTLEMFSDATSEFDMSNID